jgi:hypothetical protein
MVKSITRFPSRAAESFGFQLGGVLSSTPLQASHFNARRYATQLRLREANGSGLSVGNITQPLDVSCHNHVKQLGLVGVRCPPIIFYSYGHLLVITGYKWDYTIYKWGS